jgi:hypothetical protein
MKRQTLGVYLTTSSFQPFSKEIQMSSNKQFKIQNGVGITGAVEVGGQLVIDSTGKVVLPAINDVVTSVIASSSTITDLQIEDASIRDYVDASVAGNLTPTGLTVNGNSVVTGSLISSKKTNITATSMTIAKGTHLYVSAAGQTITLPASPSIGDSAHITVGDFTDTVISRNGSNIMGLAEDFTMDAACLSINFTFTDTSKGWAMS